MINKISIFLITIILSGKVFAQELPIGYIKHYKNSFSANSIDTIIKCSSNTNIEIAVDGKRKYLKMESLHLDSSLLSSGQLILSDQIYGEFIMDIKLYFGKTDSVNKKGLFLLTGIRDSSNYYSIHISEDSTHFYRKYKGKIDTLKTEGHLSLEPGKWHKLKITRDILSRSFTIEKNNELVLVRDASLVMGYIGFGTNYWLGIDDLTIWAPTSIKKQAPLFINDTLITE